ncbi:MAG: hypothetical protein KDE31_09205, partial [Caldilineaceae bacterium]|nr:hypothetical protein [Caldilineaceae bacterium]
MMLWHGGALAQPNKVAQRPQVTAADAAATLGEMPLSTPGPVRVRAGTAQTASDAISVTVPLDLVVLTEPVNVGVISLTLSYDASLLSATACQLSDALTLLRCNIATPGQIRLAGVAPRGIRSAVNLAQLVFTPQQSINLTAPLTIQLDVVGDVDGAAVSTDSQAGTITLTCALNERCNGLNVYLPWVNR